MSVENELKAIRRLLEAQSQQGGDLRRYPLETEFPRHLFIPHEAESVDIREVCIIEKNTITPSRLMTVTTNASERIIFTQYAVFTDAENASLLEFIPKLQGSRIMRYHGRADDINNPRKYIINVGLAPDLSNASLINSLVVMQPSQTLTWDVTNLDTEVDRPMGIRMVGYLDTISTKKSYNRPFR